MHTRKKGRAKSHKPKTPGSYAWITADKDEILKIIERLAKEGKKKSEIGRILRDEYGVPTTSVLYGKSLGDVLKEKNWESKYPDDLMALIQKAVGLKNHLKKNPRDKANQIKHVHVESKIKRLVKYYRGNKLPSDWTYDPDEAALLVK